jgi:hypothetical protein
MLLPSHCRWQLRNKRPSKLGHNFASQLPSCTSRSHCLRCVRLPAAAFVTAAPRIFDFQKKFSVVNSENAKLKVYRHSHSWLDTAFYETLHDGNSLINNSSPYAVFFG